MEGINLIQDLAVILLVSGLVSLGCHRAGISPVLGYLLAGILVGPFTPPYPLVDDIARVHVLSQLGLVFLMFTIGLGLNIQKLRKLGFPLFLATLMGAMLMLLIGRLAGVALGWSGLQSLFLSATLMVSSSAIIAKVVHEIGAAHDRPGQTAVAVTLLEDVVTVVMLALLGSLISFDSAPPGKLVQTVGALGGFVILLLSVGFLFVPRWLGRLQRTAPAEIRNVLVVGLLLGCGWAAVQSGYSLALGAVLLGAVVSASGFQASIERVFEGLRDVFMAVFFVSMGMLFDFRLLAEAWPMVLLFSVLALVGRPLMLGLALTLAGRPVREAVRSGLFLTPIGEFSFIIAQMGVAAAVMPESFYAAAVGLALVTTLVSPLLMKQSEPLADWVVSVLPKAVREWEVFYRAWLDSLARRRKTSVVWKLVAPRIGQLAMEWLLVTGLLIFPEVFLKWIMHGLKSAGLPGVYFQTGAVTVFGALFAIPLVALWRNLSVMSEILAEATTQGVREARRLRILIATGLKLAAAVGLMGWFLLLAPSSFSFWVLLPAVLAALFSVLVMRRKLIHWHSHLEITLREMMEKKSVPARLAPIHSVVSDREDWGLELRDLVLPDQSALAGRTLGEADFRAKTGVSVVALERHGVPVHDLGAATRLYAQDRLVVVGTPEQISRAEDRLQRDLAPQEEGAGWADALMEAVTVPSGSVLEGKTLQELDMPHRWKVQVTAVQKRTERIVTPGPGTRIEAGDELLVAGSAWAVKAFLLDVQEEEAVWRPAVDGPGAAGQGGRA
jgi:CPA2 family monovalent cation:H+ antiporter-2